jgi:hypothetical protein
MVRSLIKFYKELSLDTFTDSNDDNAYSKPERELELK